MAGSNCQMKKNHPLASCTIKGGKRSRKRVSIRKTRGKKRSSRVRRKRRK